MNYIAQINGFWAKFSALPDGKPYHISLFFALLNINNKCAWTRTFSVSLENILNLTRLDKNTYYKACKFLHENEFLEYFPGRNKYEAARFTFRLLSDISESERNVSGINAESKRNINKHINNKTDKLNSICKKTCKYLNLCRL